ncbi:MAG: hypothetical protein ACD_79C01142G0002 [uncultured bacterium]|nr:MAG: hypothetical protein ACD_79C01142G0002 [uncultured bacterium]
MISGFLGGLSAWTKEEGLIFLFCLLISMLFRRKNKLNTILLFLIGASPALLIIIHYKIFIAAELAFQNHKIDFAYILLKTTSIFRYKFLVYAFIKEILTWGNGLIFLLALTFWFSRKNKYYIADFYNQFFSMLIALLICFFIVYLCSPYNVVWHFKVSFSRIIFQYWPSILFFFMLPVKNHSK